MNLQRLDKIIASQFNISRSDARKEIRRGKVTLNGGIIKDPSLNVDVEASEITYGGQILNYKKHIYLIMNKPKGVISASDDKSRETVVDLVPEHLKRQGLFPVGRLDRDTTGLLLITDDGDFAHKVISPKMEIPKTYLVTVDNPLPQNAAEIFKNGITLADGTLCRKATLKDRGNLTCEITISEGKYHQIKRMFGVIDIGVNALHRLSLGGLTLPEDLSEGDCRELTNAEFERIFYK